MNEWTKYVKSVNKYKHILFFKRFLFYAHLCNICCTFLNLSFFFVCLALPHSMTWRFVFNILDPYFSCCICWCSSRVILFISFGYMFCSANLCSSTPIEVVECYTAILRACACARSFSILSTYPMSNWICETIERMNIVANANTLRKTI